MTENVEVKIDPKTGLPIVEPVEEFTYQADEDVNPDEAA